MIEQFNKICEFKSKNIRYDDETNTTNNPIFDEVKNDLEKLKSYLEKEFSSFYGHKLSIDISSGAGKFTLIPYVAILPEEQKVSDGIYSVICFDIEGKGALVGCAESIKKKKGLPVIRRKKRGIALAINVKGSSRSDYNNAFVNPKEFYYPLSNYEQLIDHLKRSVLMSLGYLGKIKDEFKENVGKLDNSVEVSQKETSEERKKRLEKAPKNPSKSPSITYIYERNPDVIAEVLYRAKGICEKCNAPAPFIRKSDNSPYLEVHHIVTLANGGDDTVDNCIAVCPNCHRELHFGF